MDGQGRFRIPAELFQRAGLGTEAVLVGVGDHMELWEPGRWEQYITRKQENYDDIAEKAFGEARD